MGLRLKSWRAVTRSLTKHEQKAIQDILESMVRRTTFLKTVFSRRIDNRKFPDCRYPCIMHHHLT